MDRQFHTRKIATPNVTTKSIQANSPAEGYLLCSNQVQNEMKK